MAVKEFTKAYQTSDGKVFVVREDAERHEEIETLLRVIRQAEVEAWHDDFGHTRPARYHYRLAEELIGAGLRLVNR